MFVLCVHDHDTKRGDCVKHYKIRKLDNGGCFITSKALFNNHTELIKYYQGILQFYSSFMEILIFTQGDWQLTFEPIRQVLNN